LPTYEPTETFLDEYSRLAKSQRAAFRRAVEKFVEDIGRGQFRPGLRVKGIQGMPGCFEMTWEADGRAIFTYGREVRGGEPHIVWLAIGTHAILP
jgi:hypothetical protein